MAVSGLNWDDLRIVQAVCRTGSFSRAARSLQLNETTISRRVLRLEDELGTSLFDAVNGERRPTAACRAVVGNLDMMANAAADIARMLGTRDHASRKLRLTTISAIAEYLLAPRLGDLFAVLPDLSLALETSDSNVDMSRWEADLAIRLGRPRQGAFLMRKIGTLNFWLIRPAGSGASRIAVYPEALAGTPEMQALLAQEGLGPVLLETSDLKVMRRLLEDGLAVGVLPDFLADEIPAEAPVVRTPLQVSRDVWLLSQPHLRDDHHAKQLSDWCVSLFAARSP
ncbi:LysR family transcriptional regulator [Paracoccus sp. pheM1]|uniref:LysR family transcriptional regulator n=1 Tax=Paracoccus sp. pheM1 TaxID=2831675 RepID=UPI001BDB83B5|nr:LysR family transcriptional regulator [Paracoccus sp. pheM1]MBT0782686.1 LysR family transcriptional regulator [Paracoccus sp. pheM1]